jgi:hypothetical protein
MSEFVGESEPSPDWRMALVDADHALSTSAEIET